MRQTHARHGWHLFFLAYQIKQLDADVVVLRGLVGELPCNIQNDLTDNCKHLTRRHAVYQYQ